jgi:hypothetical protein
LKRKGSFYLAVFFALLGLFGVLQSLTFHYWEAMALPMILSSIILIVSIVEIIKELRNRPVLFSRKASALSRAGEEKTDIRSVYWLWGWMIVFAFITYVFGFLIAIPVFAFSYLKWQRRSWLVSTSFAVISLAIIYSLFEVGLKTELFRGWLFAQ